MTNNDNSREEIDRAYAAVQVHVLPATSSIDDVLAVKPDGVFFSNGPGDPAASVGPVLPGMGDAWDAAGPAVGLVLASILADVWLESGFETFDLIQVINGVQRLTLNPALLK